MKHRGIAITLLVGIAIGALGAAIVPRVVASRLPMISLGSNGGESFVGRVTTKRRAGERLLLTVVGAEGAVLATLKRRVDEADLLISEGDSVTLQIEFYKPFIEDPVISAVRKGAADACVCEAVEIANVPEQTTDSAAIGRQMMEQPTTVDTTGIPDAVRDSGQAK